MLEILPLLIESLGLFIIETKLFLASLRKTGRASPLDLISG